MKIGVSTLHGLNTDTVRAVRELHDIGIDYVELVDEYRRLDVSPKDLKEFGIRYSAHCPLYPISFVDGNPEVRRFARKHTEDALTRVRKLDIEEYVLHGGWFPSYLTKIDNKSEITSFLNEFVREVEPLLKLAKDYGIKIVLENLDPSRIGGRVSDIKFIQGRLPEVGFCYDISHAELYNQREEALKMNLDHIHIQDSSLKADDHLAIGHGKVDMNPILSAIRKKGYHGKLIVENLTVEDVKRSLAWIKANVV